MLVTEKRESSTGKCFSSAALLFKVKRNKTISFNKQSNEGRVVCSSHIHIWKCCFKNMFKLVLKKIISECLTKRCVGTVWKERGKVDKRVNKGSGYWVLKLAGCLLVANRSLPPSPAICIFLASLQVKKQSLHRKTPPCLTVSFMYTCSKERISSVCSEQHS